MCGGWTGDLAVGEDHSYNCTLSNVQQNFTNTVVATGTPSIGNPVVASDTARVTLITPTLEVAKLPVNQMAQSGNPVTFTIMVTNTGNITLTTVVISDTLDASSDDQVNNLPPSTPYSTTCYISSVTTDITNTQYQCPARGGVFTAHCCLLPNLSCYSSLFDRRCISFISWNFSRRLR